MVFSTIDNEMHNDFFIQKYNSGIQLIRPDNKIFAAPSCDDGSFQIPFLKKDTVWDLMQWPINIIFLNQDSVIKSINENNAYTCGFNSVTAALGKTIYDAYQSNAADYSIAHDKEVLTTTRLIMKEEACFRKDDTFFHAITTKVPCYNEKNRVIGLMGFSIVVNSPEQCYTNEDSFLAFIKLSHFLSAKGADSYYQDQFLNSVGQPIYLTRREMECARYLRVGKTAKGIGRILGLSARTVECYINHLKTKFKVHSKADLMEQLLKNS